MFTENTEEQFYSVGFAQYECGNWKKAAEAFYTLCAKKPMESRYWFGLGASLQEWGRYKSALKAWAMTALLDKENPYPHFHAAECALSLKNLKDASLALKEAKKRIHEGDHPLLHRISVLAEGWGLEKVG